MTAAVQEIFDAEVVEEGPFDPDYEGTYETDWDYDQAISATKEINSAAQSFVEEMFRLRKEAYFHRVWLGLGYESWDEWCSSLTTPKLPSTTRRAMALEMSQAGMTTRPIAAALGVSQMTAVRDVKAAVAELGPEVQSEQAEMLTGANGKQYKRPDPEEDWSPAPTPEIPAAPRAKAQRHVTLLVEAVEALESQAAQVRDIFKTEILDDSVSVNTAVTLNKRLKLAMSGYRTMTSALRNRINDAEE
jgi:hypothetical protein